MIRIEPQILERLLLVVKDTHGPKREQRTTCPACDAYFKGIEALGRQRLAGRIEFGDDRIFVDQGPPPLAPRGPNPFSILVSQLRNSAALARNIARVAKDAPDRFGASSAAVTWTRAANLLEDCIKRSADAARPV